MLLKLPKLNYCNGVVNFASQIKNNGEHTYDIEETEKSLIALIEN